MTRRILAAILLASLGLRVLFYHGFTATDDISYHDHADRLLAGEYRVLDARTNAQGLRFGLVLPLAALRTLFPAPVASGILTIGASLGSIAMVFLLGRRFFSERAGLGAAAFLALSPLDLQMSTSLFPEVLVACTMLGALLCFLRATPRGAAVAGLLAGIALTQKENSFYWFPFLAWWARRERYPARVWIPSVVALLLFGLLLLAFYAVAAGDPFHQFKIIARDYTGVISSWYAAPGSVARRLLWEIPSLLLNPMAVSAASYGFLFDLAVPAAWLLRREAGFRPVAVLGGSLLLLFWLFPARLIPFLPNTVLYRYLHPLVIPAVLLLGAAAERRPGWVRWGCAPWLALQLGCAWAIHADVKADNFAAAGFAEGLKAEPGRAVFTDVRTAAALRYHLGRDFPLRTPPDAPRPGDRVLVNHQYLRRNSIWYGDPIPPVFADVPASWKTLEERIPRRRGSLRRGNLRGRHAPEERAVLYRVGGP